VRVGPFNTRAEADAVAARVKTAGLQTAVLSL
jgi:cell division protein FtsN